MINRFKIMKIISLERNIVHLFNDFLNELKLEIAICIIFSRFEKKRNPRKFRCEDTLKLVGWTR